MSERSAARGRAAIIGGGVIGGGWAARFLLHGWDVAVFDPHPDASDRIAAGADWIQESVTEDLALKHAVLGEIQVAATADALIGSSTSGFKPGELQQNAADPERIIVAHPFNPVYLLPLVEIVASPETSAELVERACTMLSSIGMYPLIVRNEIDAHLADRLMESVWREALWLVKDDVATTEEIDDSIRYGFGLRWAQMGLFETFRLAGGEEGMAHFIRQFGPALHWPCYTLRELEGIRDRNLVGILRTLKERDWGAGQALNAHDAFLRQQLPDNAGADDSLPLRLLEGTVLPAWIDYNGHMTEYRYVQVFSDSCEALLRRVDMHDEYVAAGKSWYTAETHTQFFDEVGVNQPFYTTVQIMMADEKRLHVFYRMHAADDRLLATLEAMYLHVDVQSGRVVAASAGACDKLLRIAAAHAELSPPESAGRHVGQRNQG
jgi:carnitine 3-dehydrogenase